MFLNWLNVELENSNIKLTLNQTTLDIKLQSLDSFKRCVNSKLEILKN